LGEEGRGEVWQAGGRGDQGKRGGDDGLGERQRKPAESIVLEQTDPGIVFLLHVTGTRTSVQGRGRRTLRVRVSTKGFGGQGKLKPGSAVE